MYFDLRMKNEIGGGKGEKAALGEWTYGVYNYRWSRVEL